MRTPREDAFCPACPDPETAFRLEDVGIRFDTLSGRQCDGAVTFKVSRPAWEVVMLQHLRSTDDAEHRRVYDLCIAELTSAGLSAEDVARGQVQAAIGWVDQIFSRTDGGVESVDDDRDHA